jgi:c-di-GMP-binding flagellar brake protein YcgR
MCSGQYEIAPAENYDRRQSVRIPLRWPFRATIYPLNDDGQIKTCHVLANDLSGGGISLICGRLVVEGQLIQLEMPDQTRRVTVCRVAPTDDGRYLVGCQFDDVSSIASPKIPS